MGTGLGPESYAIIEQGRIGQILSSKPQDRRAVIEEAAGITKFKTRKRLAEAKLESAKQNLARVYDILEEVTRQVNSLKRQAAKARRYGELKTELEARLRVVLSGKYRLLERDAAKTAIDLNLAAAECESPGRAGRRQGAGARTSGRAGLLRNRRAAHRSAPAAGRVERGSRAHPRPPGIAGEGERRHRAAHRAGRKGIAGAGSCAWTASTQEIAAHQTEPRRARRSRSRQSRDRMHRDQPAARGAAGQACASARRPSKPAAQLILRLLGEASTLNNQLAQIEEYLAGIERETRARRPRGRQASAAEIERLEAARKQLSETMAQRQLELESVAGERRRTEEDLCERRQHRRRAAPRHRRAEDRGARRSARARNRSNRCWRIAPTPPNR